MPTKSLWRGLWRAVTACERPAPAAAGTLISWIWDMLRGHNLNLGRSAHMFLAEMGDAA
jgi:hypothetical protein